MNQSPRAVAPRSVPPLIDLTQAAARAAAAMKAMSAQFGVWLQEELDRLEAARLAFHAPGGDASTLAARAHDLKGLGGTYDYPLVSRIAGSLERVLEGPAPDPRRVDAHVDAIRSVVRDERHDPQDPVGLALVESLETPRAPGA